MNPPAHFDGFISGDDNVYRVAFFDGAGIKIRTEINGHVATLHGVAREVLATPHLANMSGCDVVG
ncbi:hypothetical protein AOT98_25595 (plasmid) [Shigella flexneri 1a]|nr:hypothetical protein AOT98_25595 [Shigella flexneri 1a]